ncbi:hypothetical protein PV04_02638 [Phialophora macrospora]|uniref:BZIP domain-containing protein n=1 Tax=Phialophora macrospora TaxID=1851006 RepID=A0A0D2FPY6_9EURO|nr:hypothetical protein PV04_02638 [Phialophora macrospora]
MYVVCPRGCAEADLFAKQLRRARGRAAQRRYRHRKDQTLAETHAKNVKLEAIVEEMVKAFLGFGDHIIRTEAAVSHGDLGPAYCEFVKTFLGLMAEVDQVKDRPPNQPPSPSWDNTLPTIGSRTTQSVVPTPEQIDSSSRSSNESVFAELLPTAESNKAPGFWPTTPTVVRPPSLRIISMPTQNPLLSGDYSAMDEFSYPEPSLWRRLLRHGMLRSYRALEGADDIQENPQSWLARSHHFSLRHASRWQIRFLTKLGLDQMIENMHSTGYGATPSPKGLGVDQVFGTVKHRELANAVLKDLEREGIWPEMVRSEELDNYLATKGNTRLVGNRLELRLFSPKGSRSPRSRAASPGRKVQTVIIDTEKLVWKLCDESICLGDGMGFPRRIINDAIVYSAVHISHDI